MTSSTLASEFVTEPWVWFYVSNSADCHHQSRLFLMRSSQGMPPSMYLLWSLQKFFTLPRNTESVSHFVQSPSIWSSSSIIENIR